MAEQLWWYVGDGKKHWIMFGESPKMLHDGGTISSRTCGYETESELREKQGISFNCSVCGDPASTNYMEPYKARLIANRQCFSCDFWLHDVNPRLVVDGGAYSIGQEYPKGYRGFLGFGGREFHIEFLDGNKVISHNLWFRGHIPERFKERFPDTAKFTNGEGWVSTDDHGGMAMNAGKYLNHSNRN